MKNDELEKMSGETSAEEAETPAPETEGAAERAENTDEATPAEAAEGADTDGEDNAPSAPSAGKPVGKVKAAFQKTGDFLKKTCLAVGAFFKKVFTSESFLAFKAKFFTSKTYKIALFFAKLLILALCIIQIVVWGIDLVKPVGNMVQSIVDFAKAAMAEKSLTFEGIIEMLGTQTITQAVSALVIVAFAVVFIFQLVLEGFSLFESRDLRYGSISAFFSFYFVALFMQNILGSGTLFDSIGFGGLFWFIIALILILAVVRLVSGDFKKRLMPILFAVLGGVTVIVMYSINAGNFLLLGGQGMAEVDFVRFLSIGQQTEGGGLENALWNAVAASGQVDGLLPLTVVVVFLSHILPFAALSLLQYSLLVLLEKTGKQYYHLKAMKSVGVCVMAMIIMNFIGSVWLYSALEGLSLSYSNLVMTVIFGILTIVLAVLPWKIYNRNYRHYIAKINETNDKR